MASTKAFLKIRKDFKLYLYSMRNLCQLLLLLVFLGLLSPSANAQGPTWQEVVGITGGQGRIAAMAADGAGNVYMTGAFAGTVSFGGVVISGNGTSNMFVAKWNTVAHRCLWAMSASGNGQLTARALAVGGNAVYVAGEFSDVATIGGTMLTSAGGTNMFVAKLTDGGFASFTWAQSSGGSFGADAAYGLTVQGSSVYVAGRFTGTTASFGNITLTNVFGSGREAFVAKLQDGGATGSFVWAERIGGNGNDEALGLTSLGNTVYVAGYFDATLIGPGNGLQPNGSQDGFVAKVVDNGSSCTPGWVVRIGGAGLDQALAVAASSAGIYLTGLFASATADFGPFTATNSGGAASVDMFLCKLLDTGPSASFAWVRQSAGPDVEIGSAIAVQGAHVLVAGTYGNSQVGSISATFGSSQLGNAGLRDLFVAKLVDNGPSPSFVWAQGAGGTGNDAATSVAVSGSGVFVGGAVVAPAQFGTLALPATAAGPAGYLARLADLTLGTSQPAAGSRGYLYPNPAHSHTLLKLPTGATYIALTDVLGRTVHAQTLRSADTEAEISLRDLSPGLYQVRVQAGAQTLSQKLVVE